MLIELKPGQWGFVAEIAYLPSEHEKILLSCAGETGSDALRNLAGVIEILAPIEHEDWLGYVLPTEGILRELDAPFDEVHPFNHKSQIKCQK